MPKCSTCAYEIPKRATNCSNCGYLVASLAGIKEQAFVRPQVDEPQVVPAQPPINPQVVQHPFDAAQTANQQPVQQPLQQPSPQTPPPFQAVPNPAFVPNAPPSIEQFQQQGQTLQQQVPPCGAYQGQGIIYPPPYPYQVPMPAHTPSVEQKVSDVSVLSIFSLALGIIALISSCIPFLGLPFGIGGIICGIACKAKKTKGESMALVVTGIIFSVLGIFISLAMLLFWLTEPSVYPLSPEQFIF